MSSVDLSQMSNCLRVLAMDAVQQANSGHPGMPMGMADIAAVLFTKHLKVDPKHPLWPNRDRFILSNGHGSMLLYGLSYLLGYDGITLEDLKKFRQLGSITAGHPEVEQHIGIETTTGPLGQGLATAVGMAIAERHLNAEFGDSIIDHHTYVFVGDGCLMEGISQEAISLAGHLRLNKMIVLFDDNDISIDGPISLSSSEDQLARFKAAGWNTNSIDGHDHAAIDAAITAAKISDKPTLIACKTVIGKTAPTKAGTAGSHGAPLGDEEIAGARKAMGWEHGPFHIPEDLLNQWRNAAKTGSDAFTKWDDAFANVDETTQTEFVRRMRGELPQGFASTLDDYKKQLLADKPKVATRKASQMALEVLTKAVPELLGGSADLTGSNLTKTSVLEPLNADNYAGKYIYYGIREHAMAAAMNGLALHGGVIPFGGTFLVFADYCRPAIRLSALMEQRVVYVMTHDSIGLGEDGPTHQPVEHLASLRAIPGLHVFRPADVVETLECWQLAVARDDGPSLLALSRQGLPCLREDHTEQNQCATGGYIMGSTVADAQVNLMATGSEVELAMQVAASLRGKGISVQVASLPCLELFQQQPKDYQNRVLGSGLRVAIEAAHPQSWHQFTGLDGLVIGMETFGASAPASDLYPHFGFSVPSIVSKIEQKLPKKLSTG